MQFDSSKALFKLYHEVVNQHDVSPFNCLQDQNISLIKITWKKLTKHEARDSLQVHLQLNDFFLFVFLLIEEVLWST